MSDGLGTAGLSVSALDHRLALTGLVAVQGPTALDARTGVMYGPGSATLVTGTAATSPMTVQVAAHEWVTTRGTADGVYLGAAEAVKTVNIAAAPGSNSRIDVIYVKQNDATSPVSPDGSTGDVYAVAQGTPAASPTKPSIPVGAVELATVTVAAGATSTNGAGVTIANTSRQTVARGARIPVRNQTERDAITKVPGREVYRLDTGFIEQVNLAGSTWVTVWRPTDVPASQDRTVDMSALNSGSGLSIVSTGAAESGITGGVAAMGSFTLAYARPVLLHASFRVGVKVAGTGAALLYIKIDGTIIGTQKVRREPDGSIGWTGYASLSAGAHTPALRVEAFGGDLWWLNGELIVQETN